MERYVRDPVGYARDRLKVILTPDQSGIIESLLHSPWKTKVKAGHSVGKTFLEAVATNWWFDTREPGVIISTAPTQRDVCDLLWTEVRLLRRRAGLSMPFCGPSAPEMRTSEEHWAKGYTARKGESFQGRHRERMLFLFDEDEGVEAPYWQTTKTMFQPGGDHAWLSIGNPTTTASQSYLEEQSTGADGNPSWRIFTLSCLNHPNIAAELRGEPPPIPTAVRLSQVREWIAEWTQPIGESDRKAIDIEFPPGSGQWYRPGGIFESRCLGRRPTEGTDTVWSEASFDALVKNPATWRLEDRPQIGVDVARFGDDWTAIHSRCGRASLRHETGNGWSVANTIARVEMEAQRLAAWSRDKRPDERYTAFEVAIKVDDSGVGGGVTDILRERGYWVTAVNAGCSAARFDRYRLRRDELWFDLRLMADAGLVSLAALPPETIARLRPQALAITYGVIAGGRREVEPKDKTKERIGRSPDDMDAVNLAYCPPAGDVPSIIGRED